MENFKLLDIPLRGIMMSRDATKEPNLTERIESPKKYKKEEEYKKYKGGIHNVTVSMPSMRPVNTTVERRWEFKNDKEGE